MALFFLGCSGSTINSSDKAILQSKSYAIAPFWNYTETPMVGFRAASIVESVLQEEGINPISLLNGVGEVENATSLSEFIESKKEEAEELGADYLIVGSVQEWRYKTGIDGEPAVSFSIKVIDLDSNAIVYSGVGAKSGWGHNSIGVVAQEVAEDLMPDIISD